MKKFSKVFLFGTLLLSFGMAGCSSEAKIPSEPTLGKLSFVDIDANTCAVQGAVTATGNPNRNVSGPVVIPAQHNGKNVVKVLNRGFMGFDKVTAFVIPEGVQEIEAEAFIACGKATTLQVPDSVTVVGAHAFDSCSSLKEIDLDHVDVIEEGILRSCKDLKKVALSDNITTYAKESFAYCLSLSEINISSKLTTIGEGAFAKCRSLKGIELPQTLTEIGKEAFLSCRAFTEATIPETVVTLGSGIFKQCTNLASVTLPANLEKIEDEMFSECSSFATFTVGNKVTEIGKGAFNKCLGVTEIVLPEGLKTIGNEAFKECSALRDINIPDSVTFIGDDAFDRDTVLRTETIEGGVYFGNESNKHLVFVSPYSTKIDSFKVEDGTKFILSDAFNGIDTLEEITLPTSLLSIGSESFLKCTALTEISIPKSVTYIGKAAFSGCEALAKVNYPGTAKEWLAIEKGNNYSSGVSANTKVACSDKEIPFFLEKVTVSVINVPAAFIPEVGGIMAKYWGGCEEEQLVDAVVENSMVKFVMAVDATTFVLVQTDENGDPIWGEGHQSEEVEIIKTKEDYKYPFPGILGEEEDV